MIGRPPEPILAAAAWGFNDILAARLNAHLELIGSRSFDISTPALSCAALGGNVEGVRLLLDKGADIEARDGSGATALMNAASANEVETVRLLLERGADRNSSQQEYAAVEAENSLHQAVKKEGPDALEIVRLLVDYDADISLCLDSQGTPLEVAVQHGNTEAVKLLLKKSGDEVVDNDLLIDAARANRALRKDDLAEFQQLLKGLSSNTSANNHLMALLWQAANLGKEEQLKSLLEARVNPNVVHCGISVLQAAAFEEPDNSCGVRQNFALLKPLIVHGADLNMVSSCSWIPTRTLLCAAVDSESLELVTFLLGKGADANFAAENGPTPMFEAVYGGEEGIVKLLLGRS